MPLKENILICKVNIFLVRDLLGGFKLELMYRLNTEIISNYTVKF